MNTQNTLKFHLVRFSTKKSKEPRVIRPTLRRVGALLRRVNLAKPPETKNPVIIKQFEDWAKQTRAAIQGHLDGLHKPFKQSVAETVKGLSANIAGYSPA